MCGLGAGIGEAFRWKTRYSRIAIDGVSMGCCQLLSAKAECKREAAKGVPGLADRSSHGKIGLMLYRRAVPNPWGNY